MCRQDSGLDRAGAATTRCRCRAGSASRGPSARPSIAPQRLIGTRWVVFGDHGEAFANTPRQLRVRFFDSTKVPSGDFDVLIVTTGKETRSTLRRKRSQRAWQTKSIPRGDIQVICNQTPPEYSSQAVWSQVDTAATIALSSSALLECGLPGAPSEAPQMIRLQFPLVSTLTLSLACVVISSQSANAAPFALGTGVGANLGCIPQVTCPNLMVIEIWTSKSPGPTMAPDTSA